LIFGGTSVSVVAGLPIRQRLNRASTVTVTARFCNAGAVFALVTLSFAFAGLCTLVIHGTGITVVTRCPGLAIRVLAGAFGANFDLAGLIFRLIAVVRATGPGDAVARATIPVRAAGRSEFTPKTGLVHINIGDWAETVSLSGYTSQKIYI
jgi:hypothetical protein